VSLFSPENKLYTKYLKKVKLLLESSPYRYTKKADEYFKAAINFIFKLHYKNSKFYRSYCDLKGISPSNRKDSKKNYYKIPFLFEDYFKEEKILSKEEEDIFINISWYDKGGNVFLDKNTFMRLEDCNINLIQHTDCFKKLKNYNFFSFLCNPEEVHCSFINFYWNILCKSIKLEEGFFVYNDLNDYFAFQFNFQKAKNNLEKLSKKGKPIIILGNYGSLHKFLYEFKNQSKNKLSLPEDSCILLLTDILKPKNLDFSVSDIKSSLNKTFAVPGNKIRNIYFKMEHGLFYISCKAENYHIPTFSRVLIRNPVTMDIVPEEEVGFIQLLTPIIESYPGHSLLTSDIGSVKSQCECGYKGKVFKVL